MGERATAAEELELSDAWSRALDRYLGELGTGGASAATLRAYRRDLLELGAWATAREREPGRLAYRDLRAYAAALSERRLARATVARKLAAVRGLLRAPGRRGRGRRESRRPARDAEAGVAPAPGARPRRGRDAARPDPGRVRRSRCATARCFELAYSCGLRAEELVGLDLGDVDFDAETAAGRRQGRARRGWCRSASRPSGRCAATWSAPARRSPASAAEPALFLSQDAAGGSSLRRPAPARALGPRGGRRRPRLAARAAPLVRHPPARGGSGPALDPGAARPLEPLDDPDLHPRRAVAAAPASTHESHPRA